MLGALDPLAHCPEAEVVGQGDHGPHDGGVGRVEAEAADEGPVDLEQVDGEAGR